ncbi:uncharacterized protein [Fopius arisanus]|uniref:Notch4 protein n=1 Tax=Fopius arisanus TaxID=64838 RepID=A0A0C9RRT5_9HYME|nr:PREDICTED: uncharacterized protein LOC105270882 [Fopius arisanus]
MTHVFAPSTGSFCYKSGHNLEPEFNTQMLVDMFTVYLFAWSLLLTAACAAPAEGCDKAKCKGPLKFYEELFCEPVYKNEKDCCPYKYNCENLKNRSTEKCYFKGHEYKIGDQLREEDANPCDIACYCRESLGSAGFTCAVVDCFAQARPGCYLSRKSSDCCPGPEICPGPDEDWPTCEVDGKIYNASDYFQPSGEPDKDCYCGPGYKGENVEPFCKSRKSWSCGTELRSAYEIQNNCPPVFYSSQSPQEDCAVAFRCQNDKDEVINSEEHPDVVEAKSAGEDTDVCKFGNLTMKLGQELNKETDYSSVCVRCICEVPPVPTCQRLPDDVCDVTQHPKFN